MKKLILLIALGVSFLFSCPGTALSGKPFSYRENKKILPAYRKEGLNDTQRLSIQITSLINQGRLDKAAQILKISGPRKAAAVLLSIELESAQYLLNFLDIKNAASTFVRIAKLDADYAGILLAAVTRRNSFLGAKLYNKITREKISPEAIFKTVSAKGEKILTALLSAKDKKTKYIISTGGARRLLTDYARANERQQWGNMEITALINSGRGTEILFRRLTEKGIWEMSEKEKMKVLLSMNSAEAAKIIKNADPYQAARILMLMKPSQAALILAENILTSAEVKRIIREMDQQDKNITPDILEELKVLAPDKAEFIIY